ncbi:MAG: hypothetical protein IM542_11775 [Pseudanabaena sp. M165S2SP1A06QC]|jgi:hypothetical protein|nr:hypothetical protein [Pseudanabaena sp. M165S2SP1A06QC]
MYIRSLVQEKLDKIYSQVKDIDQIQYLSEREKFNHYFLNSIEFVIAESPITIKRDYIWEIANNQDTIQITYAIYRATEPLIYEQQMLQDMRISDDHIKTIVLIALGTFAIGLVLFLFKQSSSNENQESNKPKAKFQPLKIQNLILVIGAAKADVLNNLSINSSPDYNLCDKLYESTKFIWIGSEQQGLSSFRSLFTQEVGLAHSQESEYDVYFVKIELRNYNEDGFNPEVSSVQRIDAFRKLSDVGKVISISERLPPDSYQNKNLYER